MNKLLITLPLLLTLTGCFDSTSDVITKEYAVEGVSSIRELCLNNVSYYFYISGSKGALSVKINSDTLLPEVCNLK